MAKDVPPETRYCALQHRVLDRACKAGEWADLWCGRTSCRDYPVVMSNLRTGTPATSTGITKMPPDADVLRNGPASGPAAAPQTNSNFMFMPPKQQAVGVDTGSAAAGQHGGLFPDSSKSR